MRVGNRGTKMLLAAWLVACGNTQTPASKSPAEPVAAQPAAGGAPDAVTPAASSSAASGAAMGSSASTEAASTAAESWLALVDAAKYRESWQAAAKLLQEAVSADDWAVAASKTRAPLGKLRSRQLRSAVSRSVIPGAPPGKYVILQFDTVFENKDHAVETITPMQIDDGSWKISGYFIK